MSVAEESTFKFSDKSFREAKQSLGIKLRINSRDICLKTGFLSLQVK